MFFRSFASAPAVPAGRSNLPRPAEQERALSASAVRGRRRRFLGFLALGIVALILALVAWLAITAPMSRSLQPPVAPSLTLLSAEGRPIARQGSIVDAPVAIAELPRHVWVPVLAIEDRRFFLHNGVDFRGLVRAAWRNLRAGEIREGGSTITQQLAKHAFLSSDQSIGRKLQEFLIAYWLELRLDKAQILSRYLSTAYFGDNVYGLRAAAHHYFDRPPERLTIEQAAMLAGLLKAPSRLNPIANLEASQQRARTVVAAMVDAGALAEDAAEQLPAAVPVARELREVPAGTYFADWVFPEARRAVDGAGPHDVRTTLEYELQRLAARTTARHRLQGAQVALVALRPDGSVAAMVGGRSYRQSPFNRATQARRPPGSTFKLFVYLAALRSGYTPDSVIEDLPVTIDGWSPVNADGRYRGPVTLREAFAESSNVAAARLAHAVGMEKVVLAARDLGVRSRLDPSPSLALGTSEVSLLELTAAYGAVLAGRYPVRPSGLAPDLRGDGDAATRGERFDRQSTGPMMFDLLWASANLGTGREAALDVPTFGKTGTSQDNRDALFVGFAGDLVVGVWVGRDDNRPLPGLSGGGLPARIWRDFMAGALRSGAIRVGADSPFDIPRFRYVAAAVPDPRPIVRAGRPAADRQADQREEDERWDRWLSRPPERRRGWQRDRTRGRGKGRD